MRKLFFTEGRGITATLATTIANYAVEIHNAISTELQNVNFVNEYRDLVGTNSGMKQVRAGINTEHLKAYYTQVQTCANLFKLNAWLREAVKAKNEWLESVNDEVFQSKLEKPISVKKPSFEKWLKSKGLTAPEEPSLMILADYCELKHIEIPQEPVYTEITEDVILNEMSVKEYCEYIGANSAAAEFGHLIHQDGEDGAFAKARKELHKHKNAQFDVQGNVICQYEASVAPNDVDAIFAQLQATHRSYNAQKNTMHSAIRKEVDKRNREALNKYQVEKIAYEEAMTKIKTDIYNKYEQELEQYHTELQNLKNLAHNEFLNACANYQVELEKFNKALAEETVQFQNWKRTELERISAIKIVIPDSLQEIYTSLEEQLRKKK